MEVRIGFKVADTASVDVERELGSLLTWIRDEEIDGLLARRDSARPAAGEMGGLSDAMVILAPGGAGAALGAALTNWLSARRPGLTVKVTRADGSSKEFVSSATRKADDALQQFLDESFGLAQTPPEERI